MQRQGKAIVAGLATVSVCFGASSAYSQENMVIESSPQVATETVEDTEQGVFTSYDLPDTDDRYTGFQRDLGPGDPIGIRAGAFMVYPSLQTSVTYDDNIYADENNTTDDVIVTVRPEVQIVSQWARHQVSLLAGMSRLWYLDTHSQDQTNYDIALGGRLDVTSATVVDAEVGWAQLHENRGDSGAVADAAEETEYDRTFASVGVTQAINRLEFSVGGDYTKLDYKDVPAFGGGTINNDFRDRDMYSVGARAGYEWTPLTQFFVSGSYNFRRYDLQPPEVAVDKDSQGFRIGAGVQFTVTNLITGEASVGYMRQTYDNDGFDPIDAPAYNIEFVWTPTALTTVTVAGGSQVSESTQDTSAGYVSYDIDVGVVHALTRRVSVNASAGYEYDDYDDIGRNDDYYRLGLGADYAINPWVSVGAGYEFQHRSSNFTGIEYSRNRVGIDLSAQY